MNIWTRVTDADALLIECEDYFVRFYELNPSFRREECWIAGDHFFSPFPPNSIRFGVFRTPKILGDNVEDVYEIDMSLSSCLLEAFDESVTSESLLITGVWLLLSVTYVMSVITGCSKPLDKSEYLRYRKSRGGRIYSEMPEALQVFDEVYRANKTTFKNMKDQIFFDFDKGDDLPKWVRSWVSQCIETLPERLLRDIPLYRTYFELSNLVCQQLGYDEKFQNMVDFVVNATITPE